MPEELEELDVLEELEDELEVRPVEDDEDELEEDELLELDEEEPMGSPPQANSKAEVASTPVSLIARLACDSDLILSIVVTLLVLV